MVTKQATLKTGGGKTYRTFGFHEGEDLIGKRRPKKRGMLFV